MKRRREFGLTRVGSITRLDRIGIPVVQVVRPLALSNCVSQGKGATVADATVSALMEALETWAAERIPPAALSRHPTQVLPEPLRQLYASCLITDADPNWIEIPLSWAKGWDLLSRAALPVPTALVDTVYTLPSPHPYLFPRTTTGLGAGPTMRRAVLHAALEVLERDAVAAARRRPHFFDHHQVDLTSIGDGLAWRLLRQIQEAGLVVGAWRVPAAHPLPIYWCHVMESDETEELAPLPAEGFGCALTDDDALAKALLEACQARLTAISGAREDVTREVYPTSYDRPRLAEWRLFLARPQPPRRLPDPEKRDDAPPLRRVVSALEAAGARAVIVVPLYSEPAGLHVVRVVAPPLRPAAQP
jgi:ribosomal protein S12 methylthiotransferase accessory factor